MTSEENMNSIFDFSANDHAIMLEDNIRLESYRRAIQNQVKSDSIVVEIGTGTGILSAYAAAITKGKVYGIEYSETTAQMAEDMMKAAGFNWVQIIRGKSTEVTIVTKPEILITETIGAIGPEENIVELCYDFKKRHPSIKTLIPSRLKVFAVPIHIPKLSDRENQYYDCFAGASFGTFDFKAIRPVLARIWASNVRYGSLDRSEVVGNPTLLADYHLGVTEVSEFNQTVDVSQDKKANAVHLYFETDLDEEVTLTTHLNDPETHWRHAYVCRPKDLSTLRVSYHPSVGDLEVRWE